MYTKSDRTTVLAALYYEYTSEPNNGKWGDNGIPTAAAEDIATPSGSVPSRIQARVDYSYDDTYRLVREQRSPSNEGNPGIEYDYRYTYDAAGNRLLKTNYGNAVASYTYDELGANKFWTKTEGGATTQYDYDDVENILSATGGNNATYSWDGRNQLVGYQGTFLATMGMAVV